MCCMCEVTDILYDYTLGISDTEFIIPWGHSTVV